MILTIKDVNDFVAKHGVIREVICHGPDETKVSEIGAYWIITIEFTDGASLILDYTSEFHGLVLFSASQET